MVDIYGNTSISLIIENTGTILTGVLSWFVTVINFVFFHPIMIFFILFPIAIYAIRIGLKYIAFLKFEKDFFNTNEDDEIFYQKSRSKFYNGESHELSGVTEDDPEYIASRDYYKTHKAPKDNFEL